MSTGWDDHEPAPLEYFHGQLMDAFHAFRKSGGKVELAIMMDGSDLNKMIAKAKSVTYAKYPKQVNHNAILKTDL